MEVNEKEIIRLRRERNIAVKRYKEIERALIGLKHSNKLLKEERDFLEDVIRQIPQSIICIDKSLKVKLKNKEAEKIFDLPEDEPLDATCRDYLKMDVCKGGCFFDRLKPGDPPLSSTTTYFKKSGEKRHIRVIGAPIRTDEDEVLEVVEMALLTDERPTPEVEDERLIGPLKYSSLEIFPIPLILLDRNYRIILSNNPFCTFFDKKKEDFYGKDVFDLFGSKRLIQALSALTQKKDILAKSVEVEINSKVLNLRLSKIETDIESPFFLVLIEDITKRKDIEKRLVNSEKLASLGQLAAGMAHEIRNPLNIITSAAYYLKSRLEGGDSDILRNIEHIQRESSRANKIITKVLDFSHPSEAMDVLCEIQEAIEEALFLSEKQVPALKTIDVVKEYLAKDPKIPGDPVQLQEVFVNLITNACEAMPQGGRLVIQTFDTIDEGKSYIGISIKDTGCGIPKKELNKIFDPFFSTKKMSTGLGLTITYGIVERHKGKIEVYSEPGKGTTFVVKFPKVFVD
jgi:PAS domain S-box-containing protein